MIKEKILENYLKDPLFKENDIFDFENEDIKWSRRYPASVQVLKAAIKGVKEGNTDSTVIRNMNKILESEL